MNLRSLAVFFAICTMCCACKKDNLSTIYPDSRSDRAVNPDFLYDIEALPEIVLTITEEDWNQYLANYDANPHNDLYVPVKFAFTKDGQTWERTRVGLRPRGNWSRRRPEGVTGQVHQREGADWHHAHFGLKFTEYEGQAPFFGSDRMTLKWANGDPSYCRELFCYDLFRRMGVWSAPRASHCRLSLYVEGDSQPAYFGVYTMVEGVRDGWLAARKAEGRIPDMDGNIWKCGWGEESTGNWVGATLSDFNIYGTNCMGVSSTDKTFTYSLKTHKKTGVASAQTELFNFMEQMRPLADGSNELKHYLTQHLDVDLFLRYLSVNVAVGMWDDYWINANNYFCYFDLQHRFYFIPYDYDNSLGTSQEINGMKNAGTQNPLQWGSRGEDRLLVSKVLSVKEFEETYKHYMIELVTSSHLMEPAASIARIQTMQNRIASYVANDTGEDMTIEDLPNQGLGAEIVDYRLLSGDDGGNDGSNFFRTKAKSVFDNLMP